VHHRNAPHVAEVGTALAAYNLLEAAKHQRASLAGVHLNLQQKSHTPMDTSPGRLPWDSQTHSVHDNLL
jgi:hypothetical protein